MRARRIAAQVAAVLVIAAIGFVVRSALPTDRVREPGRVPGTPAARHEAQRFAPAAASSRSVPDGSVVVATAKRSRIYVRSRPRSDGRRKVLRRRVFNHQRIPLTFLVRAQRKGWAKVSLPSRPNLSKGWVRRRDVVLTFDPMRVVVDLDHHRLRVLRSGRTVMVARVAVGKSLSPTPKGRYFITDVVKPKNPKGFFGTYSLGTSAHSDVYTSFEGGDGQVGIHGTSQPSAIGSDVSHGCIRVTNKVVSRLAKMLPLGTPVDIAT